MEMDRAKLRPAEPRLSRTAAQDRAQALDELMRSVQAGIPRAYATLVRQITPLLRQVARNRGVPPADLDDVVQEALLALHRCRENYDPARPFLPWVVGIAQHCARDRWRRSMREDRRLLAVRALHQAWGPASETGGGPDGVLSGGLLADSLAALIATLPPAQREAIEVVAIGEMDLRSAAEATGRSVGAIKVNLHRAREALHQRLEAAGDVTGTSRNRARSCPEPVE